MYFPRLESRRFARFFGSKDEKKHVKDEKKHVKDEKKHVKDELTKLHVCGKI